MSNLRKLLHDLLGSATDELPVDMPEDGPGPENEPYGTSVDWDDDYWDDEDDDYWEDDGDDE